MTGNFTPPDPSTLFAQSAESFTKFWTNCAEQMATAGQPKADTPPTPDSIREMRNAFLNALGGAYDEYLRSPEFTKMLGQMLQNGVQYQRQMSEMLGKGHHAMQGASRQDIDTVMEVMQHLERRLTDSMNRIDDRLAGIEKQIAEAAPPKPAEATKKPAAKPAPAAKKAVKKAAKKATRKTARKAPRKAAKKAAPKSSEPKPE